VQHLRCTFLRRFHYARYIPRMYYLRIFRVGREGEAADNSSVSRNARAHYPSYIIIFINMKLRIHTYTHLREASYNLSVSLPHPYAGNESNALITGLYASEISVVASQRAAKASYDAAYPKNLRGSRTPRGPRASAPFYAQRGRPEGWTWLMSC